jgi:hypothetical protein
MPAALEHRDAASALQQTESGERSAKTRSNDGDVHVDALDGQ